MYGLTAAPGVLWQDSAMFQFRVWHGDVAGDEGLPLAHPLYILLAKAVALLPLGNYAFRVNLFSAVCAAACLGFLIDLLLSLTRSRTASIAGTALLAVSHTFWTHAVIAEVYALYSLALIAELWLLERFFSRRDIRWLIAGLLVCGLNLSNHLLAVLHLPAYMGVVIWGLRTGALHVRRIPWLMLAFVIGSIPYLSLVVAEIADGESVLQTLSYALVGPPNRSKFVLMVSFSMKDQMVRAVQYFVMNFPTPVIVLAPLGLRVAWKTPSTRWFAAVGGAVFLVDFAFAIRYLVADQFVFYTPCYALFAIFTAIGITHVVPRSRWQTITFTALSLLPIGVYEVAPWLVERFQLAAPFRREIAYRNSRAYFLRPRKNGETSAAEFARAAFERAAPDGLLIADTTIMNTLIYVRDVEGIGRDVTLHYGANITPGPPAVTLTPDAIRPFVARGKAFVCCDVAGYVPPWILKDYRLLADGPIFRLVPK